jgi:hypothetical protein
MFHAWAEFFESHQAENSTPKSLLSMLDHSKLITQKSQTTRRPADPEEEPSKPMPEPTPEHPFGHPNVPTQKRYSPELRQSPVFFDFSVLFSILA